MYSLLRSWRTLLLRAIRLSIIHRASFNGLSSLLIALKTPCLFLPQELQIIDKQSGQAMSISHSLGTGPGVGQTFPLRRWSSSADEHVGHVSISSSP